MFSRFFSDFVKSEEKKNQKKVLKQKSKNFEYFAKKQKLIFQFLLQVKIFD